jgi:hypothetical protein
MDAAEGSKSPKNEQVVCLNWKPAKPRMRFATGCVKAAEHRGTPKTLRAKYKPFVCRFAKLLECHASSRFFCC